MPVPTNISTSDDMNASLDIEFINNFNHDMDRLRELLGLFSVETIAAGTNLKMLKVAGELNNSKTAGSKESDTGSTPVQLGSSSGTAYVEGDEVALSKFSVTYEPVAEARAYPYRKMTTGAAILETGFENAVLRTDEKLQSLVRRGIVDQFFSFLGNGTGTASAKGLQACTAAVDAALGDAMENAGDSTERVIHFMSRQDAAEYLGAAQVTTQSLFGLTYLSSFLGVENVFLTSKLPKGTMYATPVENIHLFAVDFSALSKAGLSYATSEKSLIGVAHTTAYDHVSVETHVLTGATIFPEVKDYIVKGTIATK